MVSPGPATFREVYRLAGGGLGDHLARLSPLRHGDRSFVDWFAAAAAADPPAPKIVRPALAAATRGHLAQLGVQEGGFVLLAPAATWPSKEWPRDHWAWLVRALAAQGRATVVLQPPGRPDLATLAEPGLPGGVLPPLPLEQALQVVGAAAQVVSVDGGIMHASVGMGRPTVALFGPTDPALWFPYEACGPFRVLATRPPCHPCHRHTCDEFICLPDVAPAQVLVALADLPGRDAPLD
ncbi:MAG: glycosyltransferase family 9 protein [Candidatus Krumholzibacteriia bacterium]